MGDYYRDDSEYFKADTYQYQPKKTGLSRRRNQVILGSIIALLVVAGVVVGVILGTKHKSNTSSSSTPSPSSNSPVGPVNGTASVALSIQAPSKAIPVAPTLFALSIEQDRWPEWVGQDSPNLYFLNLLGNVKNITGVSVPIRIGADSEDVTIYDPTVDVIKTVFPQQTNVYPYPEAVNISVSDAFYKLVSRLPSDTVVSWGVGLKFKNISATYDCAKAIKRAFDDPTVKAANITLKYIEVGNEPDYYAHHGQRNASWNVQEYIPEWTRYAINVTEAMGLTSGTNPSIMGGALANTSHSASGFSPISLLADGLTGTAPGELIKTFSQHYYSGNFCHGKGGLMQDLMDKSSIRDDLDRFKPDIAAVKAKGLDYIFGETNSYACHGAPGVSNAAGAAIFMLDYIFYGSQLGISQMNFHNGIGYKYNLIQPVALDRDITDGTALSSTLPPHIQPAYYAMIIAAEAIGKTGSSTAVELEVDIPRVSGYAFYEGGKLVRALFINSEAHMSTDTTPRTSSLLNLGLDTTGLSSMTVKRLTIGNADDTSGLTWGGQSYETQDGQISGSLQVSTLPISTGLYIASTEVVLLSFS